MTSTILAPLFLAATLNNGLPPGLIDAVCFVEYSHNPGAHLIRHNDGKGDSLGTCQIKLATARMMGFKGTKEELMLPEVNVEQAARYLAYQLKRYGGDYAKAVTAYNAGTTYSHGGSKYLAQVFNAWAQRGTKCSH